MLVPAPRQLCEQVSLRAVQLAREDISSRGWSQRSIQALSALPGEGAVGLRTSVKYLMHQNRGIRPFVMWWVQDRLVPLGCGRGDGPHFARGVGVGTPGWVNIPHVGRKWREQRWRHPGLKPKNFMENALARAAQESRPQMQKTLMSVLKGGVHA